MTQRRSRATSRSKEAAEPAAVLAWASRAGGRAARTCRNSCIFCFTEQNPNGCRDSLYVKDDDARHSFLYGNYITLTNLTEIDIEQICRHKISPLGISVHAAEPALRERMLRNVRAGECLPLMRRFAGAGVRMNAQIVLCPGYNDGHALEHTLSELQTLGGALISTSVVPVGLTKHRDGLTPLRPVAHEDALAAIATASRFPNTWCSDEMYLKAELSIPHADFYGDFPQLENGVGMVSLFVHSWTKATVNNEQRTTNNECTVVTGTAAVGMLTELLRDLSGVNVVGVENCFFGASVNVAGLLTGSDLLRGLQGHKLGSRLLIPASMLRHGEDVMLDDMSTSELSAQLGVPVVPVETNAESLLRAICGGGA